MATVDFFSFLDSPKFLRQEWKVATKQIIDSGIFIGGYAVERFESEWAKYLGVNHTIGVGNGYDALVIALKALGIGRGDKVAVPSHTFIATWLAVGAVGAEPVGVDCDKSGLIDLDLLEASPELFAAVIPVHMHGQMVYMPRLVAWASKNKVRIIEDCAQAAGASIGGKFAGTWGDFGAFSFYPTKNLGALGDAGSLVTSDKDLANIARSYGNYGSRVGDKYSYQFNGLNSRLDSIQAAILSINLKYLDLWNKQRQEIAAYYSSFFRELGIRILPSPRGSIYHHYILLSENRTESRVLLQNFGIKTEIHYPECAEISYMKISKKEINVYPDNAIELAKKTLSIPISPWISKKTLDKMLKYFELKTVLNSFLKRLPSE